MLITPWKLQVICISQKLKSDVSFIDLSLFCRAPKKYFHCRCVS